MHAENPPQQMHHPHAKNQGAPRFFYAMLPDFLLNSIIISQMQRLPSQAHRIHLSFQAFAALMSRAEGWQARFFTLIIALLTAGMNRITMVMPPSMKM